MEKLKRIFKKYKSRRFVFVQPGGNYGDHLIYRGAEKLARNTGIEFESIEHGDFLNKRIKDRCVIYIHGSGGLNPWWSKNPIKEIKESSKSHSGILVCGPSTVVSDGNFIQKEISSYLHNSSLEEVYFFARERTSYEYLNGTLPEGVNVGLAHDTDLHLDEKDLPLANTDQEKYTFYAIRDDKESKVVAKNPKPFSLWFDPVSRGDSFVEWVKYHALAERVVTNRLHSAILSSILNKSTTLLPNSYHKNKSVYEHSLKSVGVEWREELENTTKDKFLSILPCRIKNSKKIARAICSIRGFIRSNFDTDGR